MYVPPPVPRDGSDDAKRSVLPESFGTPVQPAAAVDCLPMVEEHHQSKCAVAEQTHVQSVRASKPSRPVSLGLRKKRFTPPASGTSAWRSPAGMADTYTSRYTSLLNRHMCNRFEQASLIVECHSDCALDNSFFRVIHADPSAHPRRNGRLRVDMKPLPLGRCSRRVHSVRLRRLKDLANAFGHASEARRRRFALPGPLFPKWQLPAQKRPCRVWTAVRGDRWPHC